MEMTNYTRKILIASTALISFLSISSADASVIKINNHSHNKIEVDVVPEPSSQCGTYCWKCLGGTVDANCQTAKQILVPADAFSGNQYFGIVGTEGGIFGTGRCANLDVKNDYEVSFFETSGGLRCESKLIKAL